MNWNKGKYPNLDTDPTAFLRRFDGETHPHPREARVLSVGQNEEDTANVLVDAGFHVVGFDLREPRCCQEPKYLHIQGDFVRLVKNGCFPAESFDYAYSLSAIEHFGLPVYGGIVDDDYDAKAMDLIWSLLRWNGTCWITVPYNKKAIIFLPHWRVYDDATLHSRIIRKFSVEERGFFKSADCPGLPSHEAKRDEDGIVWVSKEVADQYDGGPDNGNMPHMTAYLKLRKDR